MISAVEKSAIGFSILMVVITTVVVTGCGDKQPPEPSLSMLASISPVHSYYDFEHFKKDN